MDTVPCCLTPPGCFWRTLSCVLHRERDTENTHSFELFIIIFKIKKIDYLTLNSHVHQTTFKSIARIIIKYARRNLVILTSVLDFCVVLSNFDGHLLAEEIVATTVVS